ncbi:MAG: hypothetical protein GXP25_15840 [Planctomycetes bacterium]|nr:hypothetical protein [Planctomycetota bacterium]
MSIAGQLLKRKWPYVVVLTGIALVPLFLYIFQEDYRWERRFGVVRKGVLLRGSQPAVSNLRELQRDYGVKTILSLVGRKDIEDRPECKAEMEFAAQRGIRFLHMPVSIPRPGEIARFLKIVDDPKNCPVFMHCLAGTARTGLLAAVFRMERDGWSNQKALDEMVSYGFDTSNPEHQGMVDFVRGYRKAQGTKGASARLSDTHRAEKEVKK